MILKTKKKWRCLATWSSKRRCETKNSQNKDGLIKLIKKKTKLYYFLAGMITVTGLLYISTNIFFGSYLKLVNTNQRQMSST